MGWGTSAAWGAATPKTLCSSSHLSVSKEAERLEGHAGWNPWNLLFLWEFSEIKQTCPSQRWGGHASPCHLQGQHEWLIKREPGCCSHCGMELVCMLSSALNSCRLLSPCQPWQQPHIYDLFSAKSSKHARTLVCEKLIVLTQAQTFAASILNSLKQFCYF